MKALTIRQPWASLIALGIKRNETRSWNTAHRGPLAIHAGSGTTGWGRRGTRTQVGEYEVEQDGGGLLLRGPGLAWPYRLPLAAVIATVNVYDVKRTNSLELLPTDRERSLGDYSPGRFAWQTGSLIPLRPVPAVGRLGLWEWTPSPETLRQLAPGGTS
jgi:hypothetical protein